MSPIRRVLSRLAGSADRQTIARYVAPQIGDGNRSKAFRRVYSLLDEGQWDQALLERLAVIFPRYEMALREAFDEEQRGSAASDENRPWLPSIRISGL